MELLQVQVENASGKSSNKTMDSNWMDRLSQ